MSALASNPLRMAVERAGRDVESLGSLYSEAGVGSRGGVIRLAYLQAKRDIRAAKNDAIKIRDITRLLRASVSGEVSRLIENSRLLGNDSAREQLIGYGLDTPGHGFRSSDPIYKLMARAVVEVVDTHIASIMAFSMMGEDPALWLGDPDDENDAGFISPSPVLSSLATYVTTAYAQGFDETIGDVQPRQTAMKVAVARIDRRTTRCCLAVHGQIRPFFVPFHLTAAPAWTPYKQFPPFHNYCRTGIALYIAEYDDGITDEMVDDANQQADFRDADQFFTGDAS